MNGLYNVNFSLVLIPESEVFKWGSKRERNLPESLWGEIPEGFACNRLPFWSHACLYLSIQFLQKQDTIVSQTDSLSSDLYNSCLAGSSGTITQWKKIQVDFLWIHTWALRSLWVNWPLLNITESGKRDEEIANQPLLTVKAASAVAIQIFRRYG